MTAPLLRTLGAGAAALAIATLSSGPAGAVDGTDDVQVVNTETLQVYVTPDGDIQSKRVYEQVSVTGDGPVDVTNPIGQDGLRNIDGFSGVSASDGVQTITGDVDGYQRYRSVSNYDGDLPLSVSVQYLLDGEEISPDDLIGASGSLETVYTVKNTTAEPQEITYADGKGGTITETVSVPVPIVGQMEAALPPSFTDVTSQQANLAGDGQGGTKAAFTMTLFPPLGSDEMHFSYQAQVEDAVVPPTSVTAVPVNPLENPTFKTAGDSYQSGAESGVKLADGATLIDTNLLRLRDGSAKLLDGLIKLNDGGQQLSEGLAEKAAPGARKLSDGLGQLDDGVGTLDAGAQQLAEGQRSLANGLKTLYDGVDNLPASVRAALQENADYTKLLGSLTSIANGVGDYGDDGSSAGEVTLLGGLNAIQTGLNYPGLPDCTLAASGGKPVHCGVIDAHEELAKQLRSAADIDVEALKTQLNSLWASTPLNIAVDPLVHCDSTGALVLFKGGFPATSPCKQIADLYNALYKGHLDSNRLSGGVQDKLREAAGALDEINAKLNTQLLNKGAGLDKLRKGLSNPAAGDCSAALNTATTLDDCGIKEGSVYLRDVGIPLLVDGITANVRTELLAGIGTGAAGCDPTKTLRCGAEALADGGVKLTDGVKRLVEGVTLLNDGGLQLADGLDEAADGSTRLSDGLGLAREGAPKIVDGAGRLSTEGMSKLIDAGQDTAQTYGKMYATIAAGAKRANEEKMIYGSPEGAQGLTAYSYELLGDDGQGDRNLKRGIAALGLLGLGGGALLVRRRLL